MEAEGKHYITIWMLSDYYKGEVKIMEPDKFISIEWRDFDSLPEKLFLPWKNLLKSEFIDGLKINKCLLS
jgi:8-oxo-dGTP diphosphatase